MSPDQLARLQELMQQSRQDPVAFKPYEVEYDTLIQSFSQTYYGRIEGMGMEKAEIVEFLNKNPGYFDYLSNLEKTIQTDIDKTKILALARNNLVEEYKATQDKLFPDSLDPNNPQSIRERIARDDAFIQILLANAKAKLRADALKQTPPNADILKADPTQQEPQVRRQVESATKKELDPYLGTKELAEKNIQANINQLIVASGIPVSNSDYVSERLTLMFESGLISEADLLTSVGGLKVAHAIDYLNKQTTPTPTPKSDTQYHEPNPLTYALYDEEKKDELRKTHDQLTKEASSSQDILYIDPEDATGITQAAAILSSQQGATLDLITKNITPLTGSAYNQPSPLFMGVPVSIITGPVLLEMISLTKTGFIPPAASSRGAAATSSFVSSTYQNSPHTTKGAHPDYVQLLASKVMWNRIKEAAARNGNGPEAKFLRDNALLMGFIDSQYNHPTNQPIKNDPFGGGLNPVHVPKNLLFISPLLNPQATLNGLLGHADGERAARKPSTAQFIFQNTAQAIFMGSIIKGATAWAIEGTGPLSGISSTAKEALNAFAGRSGARNRLLRNLAGANNKQINNGLGRLGDMSNNIGSLTSRALPISTITLASVIGFLLFVFIPIINVAPILTTLVHLESGADSQSVDISFDPNVCGANIAARAREVQASMYRLPGYDYYTKSSLYPKVGLFWCTGMIMKSYERAGESFPQDLWGVIRQWDYFRAQNRYVPNRNAKDLPVGTTVIWEFYDRDGDGNAWEGHVAMITDNPPGEPFVTIVESNNNRTTRNLSVVNGVLQDVTSTGIQGFGLPPCATIN